MTKLSFYTALIFALFSTYSMARSPAVEPVMGLSIEEYQQGEAVPFDFSQEHEASRSPAIEAPDSFEFVAPSRTADFTAESADTKISPFIIALALLLPVVVWFGLLKNMDKELDQSTAATDTNTIDLNRERQKRMSSEQSEKKDDISKAS